MKIGRKFSRVDVQVSILMILVTMFCTSTMFGIGYYLTYKDMIHSLQERVYSIYNFLEDSIEKKTFRTINVKEDVQRDCYDSMKTLLEDVKLSTGVRYLYTAKKNDEGEFIYVVDGLNDDAEDFRYPGDLIEPEICDDMQKALDGNIVLPDEIKSTDWGKIFVTYFPIHDGDEVIGVLGIEFEAGHQYKTYRSIRIIMPLMIVGASLISMVIAVLMFRRISNPTYKDMYNTDQLTGLKNRNAFEIDVYNMDTDKKKQGIGVLSADLNNLKLVNDKLGHGAGDTYIQTSARALAESVPSNAVAYRFGGDEFIVLFTDTSEEEMQDSCDKVKHLLEEKSKIISDTIPLTMSMGCALYHPNMDESISDVCRRADASMYREKEIHHRMRRDESI